MTNERTQSLVPFFFEASEPGEVTLVPSLEDVVRHLQIVEQVLMTNPITAAILTVELNRAGLKPMGITRHKTE